MLLLLGVGGGLLRLRRARTQLSRFHGRTLTFFGGERVPNAFFRKWGAGTRGALSDDEDDDDAAGSLLFPGAERLHTTREGCVVRARTIWRYLLPTLDLFFSGGKEQRGAPLVFFSPAALVPLRLKIKPIKPD